MPTDAIDQAIATFGRLIQNADAQRQESATAAVGVHQYQSLQQSGVNSPYNLYRSIKNGG